jgi:hypothetical protein
MDDTAVQHDGRNQESLRAEIVRLKKVVKALMNRAERSASAETSNFGLFQTTIILVLLCHKRRGKKLSRSFKQVGQRTSRATIWGMIARRREAIDAGMWRSTRTGSSAWLEISG